MFTRHEKFLLAILAAINFSHIVDFMIMMPLGPQLMRIFAINPHQFGLLVSSYTFTAGLSGFAASMFIDRFDRKAILMFFYVGFALSTIGCAISDGYHFLLLARALTGMFGGVLASIVFSITSDAISIERRGTAMGIIMGSFSTASIFGVPLSLYLANHFNWHAPFVFLGVFSLILILIVSLKFPSMRDHLKGPHNPEEKTFWYSLKHILASRSQLTALAFTFCLVFGQFSIIPFLSPSFVSNAGLKESQLPLIYLFGGIISMITSPIYGRLSDRYGKKIVFYFGATASLAPIWIITHLQESPTWLILLYSSTFFLVMGGRMVPAMALISSVAAPRHRGSFMSVNSSIQQLAASTSSYLAGIIIVRTDAGKLLHYSRIGYIAMAFSFLALVLVNLIKPAEGAKQG